MQPTQADPCSLTKPSDESRMKQFQFAALAGLCLLAASAGDAAAWGRKGHGVVAQIAQDHLTPHAADRVAALLRIDGAKDMASVASWADQPEVKKQPGRPMHTVRMTMDDAGYDASIDCPENRCVVAAINRAKAILSASNLPGEQQVVALKDLIHFIGDVHQPLHAVANIGGQKVGFHGKPTTLHAVWDKGMIADQKLSYRKLARRLAKTRDLTGAEGTPEQWAVESRDIAMTEIYSETPARSKRAAQIDLPDDYSARHWPTVERRLQQAGLRLAATLNQIYR